MGGSKRVKTQRGSKNSLMNWTYASRCYTENFEYSKTELEPELCMRCLVLRKGTLHFLFSPDGHTQIQPSLVRPRRTVEEEGFNDAACYLEMRAANTIISNIQSKKSASEGPEVD
uniref:Uncharacterized protein n=1 Tax=Lotharella globosa TaxID=91324 RepID=A0A7S3YWH2_9EUKA